MRHIILLGTSHVAQQSVKAINEAFTQHKPDAIAVELDRQRLVALLTNAKPDYHPRNIKRLGLTGYLFALIGGFLQQKIGRSLGLQPGSDMKTAALLAQHHQKKLLLIDQPITTTLHHLSKQLTWKEKRRFLFDLFCGWCQSKKHRQTMRLDLSHVPPEQLITTLITHLKKRYPTFYRVLIEERNHYMSRKILHFIKNNPDTTLLVIIGAGHLEGVREILKRTQEAHRAS